MKKYIPNPVYTEDVKLPRELESLKEDIARNVHEVWAKHRLEQGWKYGEERDEVLKEHPSLVPYDELSEEEKNYDRNTAFETLKLIHKLGFQIIVKPNKVKK